MHTNNWVYWQEVLSCQVTFLLILNLENFSYFKSSCLVGDCQRGKKKKKKIGPEASLLAQAAKPNGNVWVISKLH